MGGPEGALGPYKEKRLLGLTTTASTDKISLNPGALGAEETRQSIPNLAVKLCCGDNTVGGALWEDSSAPGSSIQCRCPLHFYFFNFILPPPYADGPIGRTLRGIYLWGPVGRKIGG